MVVLIPLLVAIVGLVAFALPVEPKYAKVSRVGEICFFCGLLVVLFAVSSSAARLMP